MGFFNEAMVYGLPWRSNYNGRPGNEVNVNHLAELTPRPKAVGVSVKLEVAICDLK